MPSRLNVRPHIHILEEPVGIIETSQTVDMMGPSVRYDCIANFTARKYLQSTQCVQPSEGWGSILAILKLAKQECAKDAG